MKTTTAAGPDSCVALSSKFEQHQNLCKFSKERKLTGYSEVINYPLYTYGTDNVIAKGHAEIRRITQPSTTTLTEFAEALWDKRLRGDLACHEFILKRIFIGSIHGSIRHSMPLCWSWRENPTVLDLVRQSTTSTTPLHGLRSTENPYYTNRLSSCHWQT